MKDDDHFEFGKKIGENYRHEFKMLYLFFRPFFRNYSIKKEEYTKTPSWHNLEKYVPEYIEEVKGLSQGISLEINKLIRLQNLISLLISENCTITAMTSPATFDNKTYLTQNIDTSWFSSFTFFMRFFLTRKYHIHLPLFSGKQYRYMFLGLPIVMEFPLINEMGLGWRSVATILSDSDEKQKKHPNEEDHKVDDVKKGYPTYFLYQKTMKECKDIKEVEKLWKTTIRSSNKVEKWPYHWDFSSSTWCDRHGDIMVMEQTHSYIKVKKNYKGKEPGILWHTNHHKMLKPNQTGSIIPNEESSTNLRNRDVGNFLKNKRYQLTFDICKRQLIRCHTGGFHLYKKDSGDICRHAHLGYPSCTIFSWILNPKDMTVYWTHGQPCRCKSKFRSSVVNLSNEFNAKIINDNIF